jgi:hypothetical protein
VDVDLKEGSNTIGIVMGDVNAAVFVRFHDPGRKLTYPEPKK